MKMPCPLCTAFEPMSDCALARLRFLQMNMPEAVRHSKIECLCGADWLPEEKHSTELMISAFSRMTYPGYWSVQGKLKCVDDKSEAITVATYSSRVLDLLGELLVMDLVGILAKSSMQYLLQVDKWVSFGIIKRSLKPCAGELSGFEFVSEIMAAVEGCANRKRDYSNERLRLLQMNTTH